VTVAFVAGDHCCIDGYSNFVVGDDSNNRLSHALYWLLFAADDRYYSHWWYKDVVEVANVIVSVDVAVATADAVAGDNSNYNPYRHCQVVVRDNVVAVPD